MSTKEISAERHPLPDELQVYLADRFRGSHGFVSMDVFEQIQAIEEERKMNTDLFRNRLSFLVNNFPIKFSPESRMAVEVVPECRNMSLKEWGYRDPMPKGIVTLEDVWRVFDTRMTANNLQEEYRRLLQETPGQVRAAIRELIFPVFLEMAEEGFRISFLRS